MRPTLVELGPVAIQSWGLIFILALMAGMLMVMRDFRRMGRPAMQAFDMALWVGIGAIIFARILFVIIELDRYDSFAQMLRLDLGGLSFHGGIIGGFLAGYLYAKKIGLSFGQGADMAAPAVCLGYSVARIGCFLQGCCYGLPTALPWAINFFDVPRHPTQLYALGINLIVLAVLLWMKNRPRPFAGALWLYYLAFYSVGRFIVEFWRDSQYLWGWLRVAQAASIAIFVVSLLLVWIIARFTAKADCSEPTEQT